MRLVAFAVLAMAVSMAAERRCAADEVEAPLVVGMTGKYPPFSYFDDASELAGFDAEVARALCARLRRRCELRALDWDSLLGSLLARRIDVVVASVAITAERSQRVAFSSPYYESGPRLFALAAAGEDVRENMRIGVTLGTTYDALARRRFPNAEVRVYRGDTEALQDLRLRRIDVLLTDELVGTYLAKRAGLEVRVVGQPMGSEAMGIAVHPRNERLLASINGSLSELRDEGVLDALMDEHVRLATADEARTTVGVMAKLLLGGLANTLSLCARGLGGGLILSFALAWALVRRAWWSRLVAACVDFVRATPFIVQLFALYFGPPALGVDIGAGMSASLAIAIHSAAYLAEVFKSAYASVSPGQHMAAKVLGLSPVEALRHVAIPQMLPVSTVPVLNTLVAMIKDSAIVSVIGVYELTLQAQRLVATTFRPIELYAATAALYFVVTWPLILLGRRLERRYRAQGLVHG